jgi:hypothetical protein
MMICSIFKVQFSKIQNKMHIVLNWKIANQLKLNYLCEFFSECMKIKYYLNDS